MGRATKAAKAAPGKLAKGVKTVKPAGKAAAPAKISKPAAKAKAPVDARAVKSKPTAAKTVATVKAASKPAAKAVAPKLATPPTKANATTSDGAKVAATATPAPVLARFGFEAMPIVRDAGALTPLLREQLVWDARLGTGRATTADRIPTTYFSPGLIRWRITENKKPMLDIVQNSAFFAGTAEPVGLERRAGLWVATGRGTTRGLGLDLAAMAWDLNRDWPGRRLPLPPEPKRGGKLNPEALVDGAPWPAETAFV